MAHIVGKYELGKVLAAGDFDSRTRICTHTMTGAQYVVRIYDKKILAECSWMWDRMRDAVQVMRILPKHENVVEMVECFETKSSLYILMQMHSPIHFTKMYAARFGAENPPTANESRVYFTQLVRGMQHLHSHNVCHLGLAPDHLLVNDKGQVKIGNMVSCRSCTKGTLLREIRGTTATVSPEILSQDPFDPFKADMWAVGVILYFMLNRGRYPHDGANTSQNILKNRIRPLDSTVPRTAANLIEQLLSFEPHQRPSIDEVLRHPWMLEEGDGGEHTLPSSADTLTRSSQSNLRGSFRFLQRKAKQQRSAMNGEDERSGGGVGLSTMSLMSELEAASVIQGAWRSCRGSFRKRNRLGGGGGGGGAATGGNSHNNNNNNNPSGGSGGAPNSSSMKAESGRSDNAQASSSNAAAETSSTAPIPQSMNVLNLSLTATTRAHFNATASASSELYAATNNTASGRFMIARSGSPSSLLQVASAGGGGVVSSSAGCFNHHPLQCRACGRLPPSRIATGKAPYPLSSQRYDSKTKQFVEVSPPRE